jgi:hypothetical protein
MRRVQCGDRGVCQLGEQLGVLLGVPLELFALRQDQIDGVGE